MNKERLLRLADLLEVDAKKPDGIKFDLGDWAYRAVPRKGETSSMFTVDEAIPLNCNTAACAIGLAALSGVFAKDGLTYAITDRGTLTPKVGADYGFDAVEKFFDLPERDSCFLFDWSKYPEELRQGAEAELYVAQRIRQYVDSDGVTPN